MLEIKNLSCGYDGNDVIHNVSFNVRKGETISIIGPNGCGKSTILKAIAGIIEYEGIVNIENEDRKNIKRKDLAKKIALMSQNAEIFFEYTVYEAVALGRYPYMKDMFSSYTEKDNEIILNSLKEVGILDIKDRNIKELSGGQLQRVYLARAFTQEPEIILLDEPTNHLDLKCQIEILTYINKWARKKNKIVIGVLHDLNLVSMFSEKVILIEEGKIVLNKDAEDVLKSDEIEKVYGINIRNFMREALKKWI
ncbi:MAG: ABC transporter ATP-binding protein [Clostridium sp.]|uniref:ABC transporter ATP-binding protein n=1 Tax=Clostridium sp. TaxID=1506 RepID=UPI003EE662BC